MPDEEKQWYELVKHNFRTSDPATREILDTVRGLGYAQRMADVLTDRLTPGEKLAGFAVYHRKANKPAGVDRSKRRGSPNTRGNPR